MQNLDVTKIVVECRNIKTKETTRWDYSLIRRYCFKKGISSLLDGAKIIANEMNKRADLKAAVFYKSCVPS